MYSNHALFFEGFSRIESKGKYIPKIVNYLTQNYLGTIIFFLAGDRAVTIVSPYLRYSWRYNPDWSEKPERQWIESYAIQGMTANIHYGIGSAGDAYKLSEYGARNQYNHSSQDYVSVLKWYECAQFFWEGDVRWIKKNRDNEKGLQLNYAAVLNEDRQNRCIAIKIESTQQEFYIKSTVYSPDQIVLDGLRLWMLENKRIHHISYPYDDMYTVSLFPSDEDIIGFCKNKPRQGIIAITKKEVLCVSSDSFQTISPPIKTETGEEIIKIFSSANYVTVATNQNSVYLWRLPISDNGSVFQANFKNDEKIADIALIEDSNSIKLLIVTDFHQFYVDEFTHYFNRHHRRSVFALPGLTEYEKRNDKFRHINEAITLEEDDAAGYGAQTVNLVERVATLKKRCFFNDDLNQLIDEISHKLQAKVLQKIQAEQGGIMNINKLIEFKALKRLETLLSKLCEKDYFHPTKESKLHAIKQYQKEVIGGYWYSLSPTLRTVIMTFVGALVGFVIGLVIGGPVALITAPATAGLFSGGVTHFTSKRSEDEVLALDLIKALKTQLVVA